MSGPSVFHLSAIDFSLKLFSCGEDVIRFLPTEPVAVFRYQLSKVGLPAPQ